MRYPHECPRAPVAPCYEPFVVYRARERSIGAFTAVEAAFAAMILAVLAAVAVPLFFQRAARARTAEAPLTLAAIASAEMAYYDHSAERPDTAGNLPPRQFLPTDPCPEGAPLPSRRPGNWNAGAWPYLGYATDDAVYYTYQVVTAGTAGSATATVIAHGDLDGDGVQSTFLRTLTVDGNGHTVAGPLLYLH